ncbi:hypothetical protein ELS17_17865 [Natrinema altunense]|uniref:Uncharacterized protein n=1 Tax=Natrinema altunense TaxID=222984 RepID=A0A482XYH4_9EURY|nr:hypothetical protein ELS17_17865 [Natrinema altunense]
MVSVATIGLGVILWWWPAAIFVAFSNTDVTSGARAFAIFALYFGIWFMTLDVSVLTAGITLPATVSLVGALLLLHPVTILGVSKEGPITPLRAGLVLLVGGVVSAVVTVL